MSNKETNSAVTDIHAWERILDRISVHFENNNFGDYVQLLQRPYRLILINFIAGIGRGVGIGLGFTFVAAILIWILQQLTIFHLPFIGNFIADIVKIVKAELHTPTI